MNEHPPAQAGRSAKAPHDGGANQVDVTVEDEGDIRGADWYRRATQAILSARGISSWEVSILVTSAQRIRLLNADFRGIDEPTDVLSFPQFDPQSDGGDPNFGDYSDVSPDFVYPAGDIVIAPQIVAANARDAGCSDDEELLRVLLHGVLHLEGMDHATNAPGEPMLRLQEQVLEAIGAPTWKEDTF